MTFYFTSILQQHYPTTDGWEL